MKGGGVPKAVGKKAVKLRVPPRVSPNCLQHSWVEVKGGKWVRNQPAKHERKGVWSRG